jgi:hypothetical protein
MVKELGGTFFAFSVEVQGRFGEQAQKQLSSATGVRAHVAKKYWARRIACTIQNKVAEAQQFKAARIRTTEFSMAYDAKETMNAQTDISGAGMVGDSPTTHWEQGMDTLDI